MNLTAGDLVPCVRVEAFVCDDRTLLLAA